MSSHLLLDQDPIDVARERAQAAAETARIQAAADRADADTPEGKAALRKFCLKWRPARSLKLFRRYRAENGDALASAEKALAQANRARESATIGREFDEAVLAQKRAGNAVTAAREHLANCLRSDDFYAAVHSDLTDFVRAIADESERQQREVEKVLADAGYGGGAEVKRKVGGALRHFRDAHAEKALNAFNARAANPNSIERGNVSNAGRIFSGGEADLAPYLEALCRE